MLTVMMRRLFVCLLLEGFLMVGADGDDVEIGDGIPSKESTDRCDWLLRSENENSDERTALVF